MQRTQKRHENTRLDYTYTLVGTNGEFRLANRAECRVLVPAETSEDELKVHEVVDLIVTTVCEHAKLLFPLRFSSNVAVVKSPALNKLLCTMVH